MPDLVVFPDVELVIAGKLAAALPAYGYALWADGNHDDSAVFVSNRRGEHKRAIWVRSDGGSQLDQVRQQARMSLNVFDADEDADAIDLARIASAILRGAADGDPILRTRNFTVPISVPDPTGPRRFVRFDMDVRGSALVPTP